MVKLDRCNSHQFNSKKTEHRTNLPPWITSRTSRILQVVKLLERKQLMRFDAQRFSKISQLTAAALELSKEDLSLIESSVFLVGCLTKSTSTSK